MRVLEVGLQVQEVVVSGYVNVVLSVESAFDEKVPIPWNEPSETVIQNVANVSDGAKEPPPLQRTSELVVQQTHHFGSLPSTPIRVVSPFRRCRLMTAGTLRLGQANQV